MPWLLLWAITFLSSVVVAQKWAIAIPIAVRAPHFNSYISLGANQTQTNWPTHWKDGNNVGWTLWMSVDGERPTKLFGGVTVAEAPAAMFKDFQLTPTRSILTVEAGAVEATVTFLNPIEPDDLVLQSFPFVYMYCNVSATDGREHSVRLYSDVTGEWLATDPAKKIRWNFTESDSMFYHNVWLTSPGSLSYDDGAMAEDAFLWFASAKNEGVTYRAGAAPMCRRRFTDNGLLENAIDEDYRGINEKGFPGFAFARDLGNISSSSDTAVWALGLTRDPLVSFKALKRRPYYTSKYTNIAQAMSEFLSGFEDAKYRAIGLDHSLMDAARSTVSDEYADLVAIGARLTLGAMDFTIAKDEHENDTMAFMAVSDDSRVSAVDTIFASFPALLRLNATWAGYLLQPLLEFGKSAKNTFEYASYDLGTKYPTISTQKPPSQYSTESTCDMLIMVWAQARVSGDATRLNNYYYLLKKWADYLVDKGVDLTGAMKDGNGISNANLALKSVLGVKCMSLIAETVGLKDDQKKYSDSTGDMYEVWKKQAFQEGHIVSGYSSASSWGLIYSLFYDKMLRLAVVDDEVYAGQDAFYKSQIVDNTVSTFGVSFDSLDTHVSAPWNMLAAAATNNTEVRNKLVSQVRAKMYANGTTKGIFPAMYSPENTASMDTHSASPAHGAMLSLLAMDLELQTPIGGTLEDPSEETPFPSSTPTPGDRENELGTVIGASVGGLAILITFLVLLFFYRRTRRNYAPQVHLDPFRVPPPTSSSSESEGNTSSTALLPLNSGQSRPADTRGNRPTSNPPDSTVIFRKPRLGESPEPVQRAASTSQVNSRGLHGEVEDLRREMDRLRTDGLMLPPSYDMGRV